MRTLLWMGLATMMACGDKGDTGDSGGAATDDSTASEVWADMSGYTAWTQVTGFEGVQATGGPHGAAVQVWLNDVAAATVAAGGGGDMPAGAIIVKEAYSDDAGTELAAITVMAKIDGYAPDTGDWFWGMYSADGTASVAGADSSCYGCHESGQDYVKVTTW